MEINENIKLLCKARGISFADLADRLKITRQTLYKQSTGAAQLASIERIAAALALPAWIILHPRPLAALAAWNQDQRQGRTDSAAAVIFCPYCKRPIQIHTAPDLAEEKRTAEDGPSSWPDSSTDPDTWPEEDSRRQTTRGITAGPEKAKNKGRRTMEQTRPETRPAKHR